MLASLKVSVLVDLALYRDHKVELNGIVCERMQWIASAPDIESAIREILGNTATSVDVRKLQAEIGSQIAELLSREQLEIEPDIRFRIEARDSTALKRLTGNENSRSELIKYEEYVKNRSAGLSLDEVELLSDSIALVFHPDPRRRRLSIRAKLQSPVWLSSIALELDGKQAAAKTFDKLFEPGEVEVQLPDIPVRQYEAIRSSGRQSLIAKVGEEHRIEIENVQFHVPDFSGGSVSLFMDMGSTRSKLISMTADTGEQSTDSHLTEWIESLDANELTEDVAARIEFSNPVPTGDFLDRYLLPQIEKRRLAEMSDPDLARWLGEAVHRFCVYFANESSPRSVAEMVWSFPRTKGKQRDFTEVARLANKHAGESMLGKIRVVEEHEALHYRFKGILRTLADSSRSIITERDAVKQKKNKLS